MSQPPITPNYQTPQPAQQTNPLAVISLVTGILACLSFCRWWVSVPLAVIAIVLSVMASGQIRQQRQAGSGMAKAGLILGIIGAALAVIMFVIFLALGKAAKAGGDYLQRKTAEIQKQSEERQRQLEEQLRKEQERQNSTSQPGASIERALPWKVASAAGIERTLFITIS